MGLVGLLDDCFGRNETCKHELSNSLESFEVIPLLIVIILISLVYFLNKRKPSMISNWNSQNNDILMQPKVNRLNPIAEQPPFSNFKPRAGYLLLVLSLIMSSITFAIFQ